MTIERKLLGTTPVSGEVLPEGVSFDGSSDYLSQTSDLTNNTDSKTFTFSCWVYKQDFSGTAYIYVADTNNDGDSFTVNVNSAGAVGIVGKNSSGGQIFNLGGFYISKLGWNSILVSIDLISTSKRKVYLNDISVTSSVAWNTYTDDTIDFTHANHKIGNFNYQGNFSSWFKGRLAHLFLDYTYRDLSTTSNRRLFITADGKPSKTIPSSPILYLPMTDAATAGSNSGTGGDFTVNGVLATAERGPNQDNCSASTFDGSNDYLSRASISGLSDGKLFTFSVNASQTSGNGQIFTGSNGKVSIKIAGNKVTVRLKGSNSIALYFNSPYPANELAYGQHNSISFSCDLSDTSKRHMFINGVDVTSGITFTNYSNETALLVQTPYAIGAAATALADVYTGSIGEFYLDTAYYDLATDNPFWDSDTNRPNSVRKVIADTGVTPAIAMPLMGNDAGNNLGSGGDFTVNSGPYTGARGGSEFWARSVKFDGCSNKLETTAAITSSTTYELSGFFFINQSAVTDNWVFEFNAGQSNCAFFIDTSNKKFILSLKSTSGAALGLGSTANGAVWNAINQANTWIPVFFCVDVNNGTVFMQVQGASESYNLLSTVNPIVSFNSGVRYIGNRDNYECANYQLSNFYMTSSYIDFSQEANRNKFVDQLGYPIDLTDISDPFLYMKFDPSSLGTNSGTGGNFTVNGTVVAGADVDP